MSAPVSIKNRFLSAFLISPFFLMHPASLFAKQNVLELLPTTQEKHAVMLVKGAGGMGPLGWLVGWASELSLTRATPTLKTSGDGWNSIEVAQIQRDFRDFGKEYTDAPKTLFLLGRGEGVQNEKGVVINYDGPFGETVLPYEKIIEMLVEATANEKQPRIEIVGATCHSGDMMKNLNMLPFGSAMLALAGSDSASDPSGTTSLLKDIAGDPKLAGNVSALDIGLAYISRMGNRDMTPFYGVSGIGYIDTYAAALQQLGKTFSEEEKALVRTKLSNLFGAKDIDQTFEKISKAEKDDDYAFEDFSDTEYQITIATALLTAEPTKTFTETPKILRDIFTPLYDAMKMDTKKAPQSFSAKDLAEIDSLSSNGILQKAVGYLTQAGKAEERGLTLAEHQELLGCAVYCLWESFHKAYVRGPLSLLTINGPKLGMFAQIADGYVGYLDAVSSYAGRLPANAAKDSPKAKRMIKILNHTVSDLQKQTEELHQNIQTQTASSNGMGNISNLGKDIWDCMLAIKISNRLGPENITPATAQMAQERFAQAAELMKQYVPDIKHLVYNGLTPFSTAPNAGGCTSLYTSMADQDEMCGTKWQEKMQPIYAIPHKRAKGGFLLYEGQSLVGQATLAPR